MVIVVIGYPIVVLVVLTKNQPKLHLKEYRDMFGEFYLNFRYQEGRIVLLEPFYSALRRLVQAAAVVFLIKWPAFQFITIFYSWNFVNLLNSISLRFKLKLEMYTEMVNEFFIVILLYHLLVFTDYISDQKAKNLIGWSMVATMLLNMFFNFTLIITSALGGLYKDLRLKYWTWKKNRLMAKLKVK